MLRNSNLDKMIQEARVFHGKGMLDAAESIYEQILNTDPKNSDILHLLGVISAQKNKYQKAIDLIDAAIKLDPTNPAYYLNRGNAQFLLNNFEAALESYEKAINLKPDYVEALSNKGNALKELKQFNLAIRSYERAISINSSYPDVYYNKGIALFNVRQYSNSVDSFSMCINLDPESADAYYNRGLALLELGHYQKAIKDFSQSIKINPNCAAAYCARGLAFRDIKEFSEAISDFEKVIKIDSTYPLVFGYLFHIKSLICDWINREELVSKIEELLKLERLVIEPFVWQAGVDSAASLLSCARIYCHEKFPSNRRFFHYLNRDKNHRIRIGYVSGELGDYATTHLIAGILQEHDRDRFEVFCFDNGVNDKSALRKRLEDCVREFKIISSLSDDEASNLIHQKEIDILINLNVFFGRQRNGVFAMRPAPIQVNYLGFPGTMGADYMDYIIADKVVLPPSQTKFYSEKIIYLPSSYQATDRQRIIGVNALTRKDHNLPENCFVFCCFNNNYKITPQIFSSWMLILHKIQKSVLWLLEDNPDVARNLRREAVNRGIEPDRLVFAPRVGYLDHLARHKFADLCLDTLPCNAHTTANDALWTETPFLTCSGQSFPGKVGHSLLEAIRVPDLITYSLDDYQKRAVELALSPEKLRYIKEKIKQNRLTTPLFDTQNYTRHLETAFNKIHNQYKLGRAPADVDLTL